MQMKEMEFLFPVAQISVVYVGFATLIVVVAQQFSGARGQLEAARLVSMLFLSLLAVVFSLFPYLPFYLGLPAQTSWRISCFLLGFIWLLYYALRIRWIRFKEHRNAVQFMSVGNRVNMFLIHPISILCVLSGALGFWGELVGFVYLCAIFVLLIISAYLFLVLVMSLSAAKTD